MADDNNNNNNDNNDNDNNDNDDYGTMIMTDDIANGYKQNGYKQNQQEIQQNNNNNNNNNNNYNDDDNYDNYGTMIMTSDPKEEEINSDNLVSIFDGQSLTNSVITLPDNPTKQELLNINETLK